MLLGCEVSLNTAIQISKCATQFLVYDAIQLICHKLMLLLGAPSLQKNEPKAIELLVQAAYNGIAKV